MTIEPTLKDTYAAHYLATFPTIPRDNDSYDDVAHRFMIAEQYVVRCLEIREVPHMASVCAPNCELTTIVPASR